MKKITIIGGGLAGVSAAVLLSERGYRVELFEAANHLGGRAFSFRDKDTGDIIDNGQHILMGCYKYTLKFLELINGKEKLKIPETIKIEFRDTNSGKSLLEINKLPAPFHLLKALHSTGMISSKEFFSVCRLALDIYKINFNLLEPDYSIEQLFKKNRQSANLVKKIWQPITISALNGMPNELDAGLFCKTIYRMFFKSYSGSRFLIPSAGLSELFIEGSLKILRKNDVLIHLGSGIKNIDIENNMVVKVQDNRNVNIESDYFIFALPFQNLLKFPDLEKIPSINELKKMRNSPIISIYLWLEEKLFDNDFIFIQNTNIQVIFNRSVAQNTNKHLHLYCIVISSANHLINCSKEYILQIAKHEIEIVFKRSITVRFHKIIKERNATLLITPMLRRQSIKTEINNLFFIGDWINTGLPATIESAIFSSYKLNDLL